MDYKFYDKLNEDTSDLLMGTLSHNGDLIRWEYDCFGQHNTEEHLMEVYHDDVEILLDNAELDEYSIGEPQIEMDFISFYIEI
jgi:hypothetical protein